MKNNELRMQAFGKACRFVVGSPYTNNDALLDLCRDEVKRLEEKFSAYHVASIISRINQGAGSGVPVPLDAESRSLFRFVDALWQRSNHVFDPTVCLLHATLDERGRQHLTQGQLSERLKLVGWQQLQITDEGAMLPHKGMLIDLNNCICPYAIDSLRKRLLQESVDNAYLEIDLDIATIGKQPDGANWMAGMRFPQGSRVAIARLKLNNAAIVVRGNYERANLINEEYFGRALSPIDGQPVPGLLSVGVIADSCVTACSAANVARLKPESTGISWLETLGLPWLAIDRSLNCIGPLAPSY